MSALFAVTGSKAVTTQSPPVPNIATPSPTPTEPTSMTTSTPSAGGWTVQRIGPGRHQRQQPGAIAGSSPSDVRAALVLLPDTANSNQDATLTFAEHYDGTKWSFVPTPNTGTNFNSFYGLAASGGQAWAVGEYLNGKFQDRALAEWWNGTKWSILNIPQPGSTRDMLFAASALSPSDVWLVGDQEGRNGKFETLAEHWNGTCLSGVPTPTLAPLVTTSTAWTPSLPTTSGRWASGSAHRRRTRGWSSTGTARSGRWCPRRSPRPPR